jgi:hypothetical protein
VAINHLLQMTGTVLSVSAVPALPECREHWACGRLATGVQSNRNEEVSDGQGTTTR